MKVAETTRVFCGKQNHQQYLAKNPAGYCGLGGCNVSYFSEAEKP
jgi:peptide-methionine (S)-S-oxide reductase